LKIQVGELTDKDRILYERQDKSEREKEFEKLWLAHKSTIPERPLSGIDSEADDAWENLVKAKDSMTKYLASRKSSYIPPSQRGKQTVDPKQEEIEKHIQKMQNEFDMIENRIDDLDKEYYAKKRSEFRKESLYLV
jgi:peptidoglycan hydrolase CwlO-like protein